MNRAAIERAFVCALRELEPAARVEAALSRSSGTSRRGSSVRIVAIGKAAPAMAAGAMARLGDMIERVLVVTSDGTDVAALHTAAKRAGIADRVAVMRAAHPLPDARSVRAGTACLAMADAAGATGARLVVLVSGGASALVCAPSPGITLRTKRAITRAMLASGAAIQDVNVVRKHLSRLKGGGLVRAAGAAHVETLVVSDVIGGAASDVGSGPSVPDDSTVAAARRLLRRFAPRFADVPLVPTLARSKVIDARTRARMIVSPEDLARVMATFLREREPSAKVHVLPSSQAPVELLAAEYVALVDRGRRARRPQIFVRAAEPAVAMTARGGRGGRSTHLAALVGKLLGERRIEGARHIRFAALASDGVDGDSGTAGAIIDGLFAERVARHLGETALDRSLER
ncbi:MAG: glycerate 2-kinase, partial [Myxococcales bacterium]|nr:glycerate 2-kinase [Myxococcales bacterium]